MATEPTNPIIRIAENDTTLPSTGLANKLEPITSVKQTGFDANILLSAENLNYILDNIGEWLQYFKDELVNREIPVGGIFEITGNSDNPSTYFGYGTWESFGVGQVTVGAGTFTDINGDEIIWADGDQSGEYNHTQTVSELATHTPSATVDPHTHNVLGLVGNGVAPVDTLEGNKIAGEVDGTAAYTNIGTGSQQIVEDTTVTMTFDSIGSSDPMNNIQPSIAVYRWVRTA